MVVKRFVDEQSRANDWSFVSGSSGSKFTINFWAVDNFCDKLNPIIPEFP